MKNKVIKSIAVLCALACVISIGQVIRIQYQYKSGEKAYNDLALNTVTLSAADDFTSPGDGTGAPIDVNFELLQEMNTEAVGWLYSPGTPINYPVVQSANNDYYLKHLYNGQNNSSGAIFMDALNNSDLTDTNTIVYGHNMKNGSMFATLQNYSEWWYYQQHPTMYYMTADKDYRIDVFACYPEPADSEVYTITFATDGIYSDYLQKIWSRSEINVNVPMDANDKILTLVTCTTGNERYIVQGKVTPLN